MTVAEIYLFLFESERFTLPKSERENHTPTGTRRGVRRRLLSTAAISAAISGAKPLDDTQVVAEGAEWSRPGAARSARGQPAGPGRAGTSDPTRPGGPYTRLSNPLFHPARCRRRRC